MTEKLKIASRCATLAMAAICFASSTLAGPLEDGLAAQQRGEFTTAMDVLRPLADAGQADAQYNVGLMYRTGQGVAQDYREAMRWYAKAAAQGHAKAQTGLGAGYRKGHGVDQDDAFAFKWTSLGAAQGNANAQRGLATMYATGQGTPRDDVKALMWLMLAVKSSEGVRLEGGGSATADRDALAAKMTPDQIIAAKKLVQAWVLKK